LKKDLEDPDKMEAARKNFLESDEWKDTFEDPDLRDMASGELGRAGLGCCWWWWWWWRLKNA